MQHKVNKNTHKYDLFGQFTDFSILIFILAFIAAGLIFSRSILYGKRDEPFYMTAVSESMSVIHSGKLSAEDTVYDTITKRAIGKIDTVREVADGDKFYYVITLHAARRPRGNALRTDKLWFYFREVGE